MGLMKETHTDSGWILEFYISQISNSFFLKKKNWKENEPVA